jgi:hypothetical protein
VVSPITTTILYIVPNAKVIHKIDRRNEKSQYPDLRESISQIDPSRKTMLKNTNKTAPANFESRIMGLDIGFDINRSIVPFSSIEGMNDAVEISEKNIIRFQDIMKNPVSTWCTRAPVSVRLITPSTASILTRKIIISTTSA